MWWKIVKVGIKNLLLHKLRSLLTLLGVILGVGSVIAMLAVGEGSKKEALARIRALGASNVIVRSVKPNVEQDDSRPVSSNGEDNRNNIDILAYGLRHTDLERLKSNLPTVKRAVPVALVTCEASQRQLRIPNARVLGTTPEFLEIKNLQMGRGRFVTATDIHNAWNVAVLASGAANRLFQFVDPIDKHVFIGNDVYRIVGVLESQDSGNGTPGAVGQKDLNEDIYIPISCVQRRLGERQEIRSAGSQSFEQMELSEITLQVFDEKYVTQTAEMTRQLLLRSHPDANDFKIQVPLELLAQANEEKRMWNMVLGSIAGISLLVGGIGIMNIMLASVTERTREIGIRRALGATKSDISVQFLVETILLSSTGGVVGVLTGIMIPMLVSALTDLDTVISVWSVVLSFGISVGIGILFGWYPAQRAASLDPIEALRHE
ncbi:ABC transporter permease [Mariniblastus fucicola]|uniref:Macrolide export ATP-binding/permease protein MacB n=1 Tax=Mariniblastus fucicola TaxID=980251 RepID=A0A5B9PBV5_9BACT|nr:ABC transporter permease [Mariniblastus fucicola]QEG20643.1 Macrolide export ATP-binding/permease protein MacB [Mariniblastus fucicola]